MAAYDVTLDGDTKIDRINFLQDNLKDGDYMLASYMEKHDDMGCEIHDSDAFVIIANKEHAKYLIRALDKAIELGWLK